MVPRGAGGAAATISVVLNRIQMLTEWEFMNANFVFGQSNGLGEFFNVLSCWIQIARIVSVELVCPTSCWCWWLWLPARGFFLYRLLTVEVALSRDINGGWQQLWKRLSRRHILGMPGLGPDRASTITSLLQKQRKSLRGRPG